MGAAKKRADGEGTPRVHDLGTLAGRLAWARAQRGYGSRQLSALAGLSDATVSLIETGQRAEINISTCFDLATALGVPPEWLAWGRGSHGLPPRGAGE